jgi:hypothetical protein
MSRKSPTLFTLTVPVTNAMMLRAASRSTWELDDFDRGITRSAGANRYRLECALVNDADFREYIGKRMLDAAITGINEAIKFGDVKHDQHPLIKATIKACDALAARAGTREANERAESIKAARELLAEAGYTVTKA